MKNMNLRAALGLTLIYTCSTAAAPTRTTSYDCSDYDPQCVMKQTITDFERRPYQAQSCTGYVFHGTSTRSDGSTRDCYAAQLKCDVADHSSGYARIVGLAVMGNAEKTVSMQVTSQHLNDDWRQNDEWQCATGQWSSPWAISVSFPDF